MSESADFTETNPKVRARRGKRKDTFDARAGHSPGMS
jgi:hypothetical protein